MGKRVKAEPRDKTMYVTFHPNIPYYYDGFPTRSDAIYSFERGGYKGWKNAKADDWQIYKVECRRITPIKRRKRK